MVAAIEANVVSRGGQVTYWHPVGVEWRDHPDALAAIDAADIVLVNGEGTVHHSSGGAATLARLGPYCWSLGRRCYLINALVQENNRTIMADLSAFSGIWTRERRSAEELGVHGISARICGELSFYHDVPAYDGRHRHGIAIDSADHRVDMRATAKALRVGLISIRHRKAGLKVYQRNWLKRFETGKPSGAVPGITTFQAFAQHLAGYSFVVTGRFHGLCFALNCGVPVAAISLSNWKNDALLEDVGLSRTRLHHVGEQPAGFADSELAAIATYRTTTRAAIASMFDAIMSRC